MRSLDSGSGSSKILSSSSFISGTAGARMMKVTGLASGQRLVWPLQTLTRSGTVRAETALALLDTTARSRAAASDALAARNRTMVRIERWCTLSPANGLGLGTILHESGQCLNGH